MSSTSTPTTPPGLDRRHPFGRVSCEEEREALESRYQEFFFHEAPFNEQALDEDTYLIVGRRGTGKTSLTQYFTFQEKFKRATCIDVDEPDLYETALQELATHAGNERQIAVPRMVRVWIYLIWSLLFHHYRDSAAVIRRASSLTGKNRSASRLILDMVKALLTKFVRRRNLGDEFEKLLTSSMIHDAQQAVQAMAAQAPVIVAIDSLERYGGSNEMLLRATAALIEAAAKMNRMYAKGGIHVKVFMADEIFPSVREHFVDNYLKYVKAPLYLHWRPKDLIRLISWRLYAFLRERQPAAVSHVPKDLDWSRFGSVRDKMWLPFFGEDLINRNKLQERTFPYVLRHTQLRPRQLVLVCNSIAECALASSDFPQFTGPVIVDGVRRCESHLATEVVNSYSTIYRNVGEIIRALTGLPMVFRGNRLDRADSTNIVAVAQR